MAPGLYCKVHYLIKVTPGVIHLHHQPMSPASIEFLYLTVYEIQPAQDAISENKIYTAFTGCEVK